MRKHSRWFQSTATLGVALSLAAPSAHAQERGPFADQAALEGREVIWSGRVDGMAARVERVDLDHVAMMVDGRERILPLRGARVGACVDASRTSTLMLTGKHGEASEAVRVTRDEIVTLALPALAASAPHAQTSSRGCHWGIALVDGTLASINALDVMQQSPVLFERIADLTEVGRGLAMVGIDGDAPIFVVSRAGRTSAWRTTDGAMETRDLDALEPMVASASSAWSVNRAGALKVYTPFVGVREVAPSQGAATTGLLATQLGGRDVLAWATADGEVLTWDGQQTELRAQWDAQIRHPLLAVDVYGDASLSLLVTLENGNIAVVQSDLAVPIELGARSARAPMWLMTTSEAPACLAMTNSTGTQCFSLRELGPMGALGNGMTPVPGEVIVDGNSGPSRTRFEPLWADLIPSQPSTPGVPSVPVTPAATPQPAHATCSASRGSSKSAFGGLAVASLLALGMLRKRRD